MVHTKMACVLLVVLAGAAAGTAAGRQTNQAPGRGHELAWSIEGQWTGVAADESAGTIYACEVRRCAELDREGKTLRAFQIDVSYRMGRIDVCRPPKVRLANLEPATKALLLFDIWSPMVVACDTNGRRLWTYDAPMGVDDVWAADVNADGRDEVIVGHNGHAGLHVLDGSGQLLWKTTTIGNVWHVSAGPLWGDGTLQVVASAAGGKVHIFSADGSRHVTWPAVGRSEPSPSICLHLQPLRIIPPDDASRRQQMTAPCACGIPIPRASWPRLMLISAASPHSCSVHTEPRSRPRVSTGSWWWATPHPAQCWPSGRTNSR